MTGSAFMGSWYSRIAVLILFKIDIDVPPLHRHVAACAALSFFRLADLVGELCL